MQSNFASGAALAFVAVLLWGAQFPIAKSTFSTIDPFHVSAIRYGAGTLLLAAFVVWREGTAALRYYGRGLSASVLGLVGMTGSPMLVFGGLALTRPEHAAIIVALQPSITAIADWWLHGRRPARFTLGCMMTAFAGVMLVVTKGDPALALGRGELTGDLLVLAGAACWVAYTMGTESFRGWSSLKFTLLTLIPGSIGLAIGTAILVRVGLARVPGPAEVGAVMPQLVFLAVGGVMLSMLCWNAGTRRIGALNAMLLQNLVPVIVFAIRFAQGQRYVAVELAGAGLVIGALAANNLYLRHKHAVRRKQAAS
jgi:drug/metabolite transporter (DMT)-like permease